MLWGKRFNLVAPFLLLTLGLVFGCSSDGDSAGFAPKAAQGGLAEVEFGRLALQRAADPLVKDFSQRMVTDHSRANMTLKTLATQKNIQLPTELSSEDKSAMDKLSKLSGAEFDKEYMSNMVKDHENDVKEFQT